MTSRRPERKWRWGGGECVRGRGPIAGDAPTSVQGRACVGASEMANASGLVLDNLAHLFHRLHFDLANSLCRYAVFIGEHLQRFFLILSEPAPCDDVA